MLRYIITCYLIGFTTCLTAQDSIKTLSAEQVMQIVKQYHPVARQASILIERQKPTLPLLEEDLILCSTITNRKKHLMA